MTGKPQRLSDSVQVFTPPDSLRFESDQAAAQALRDAIDLEEQNQRSGAPAKQSGQMTGVIGLGVIVAVVVVIALAVTL